jgi:hypothetical protein
MKLVTKSVTIYNRTMAINNPVIASRFHLIAIYSNGQKNAKLPTAYIMYACCIPSTIEGGMSGLTNSLGISKTSYKLVSVKIENSTAKQIEKTFTLKCNKVWLQKFLICA